MKKMLLMIALCIARLHAQGEDTSDEAQLTTCHQHYHDIAMLETQLEMQNTTLSTLSERKPLSLAELTDLADKMNTAINSWKNALNNLNGINPPLTLNGSDTTKIHLAVLTLSRKYSTSGALDVYHDRHLKLRSQITKLHDQRNFLHLILINAALGGLTGSLAAYAFS